MTTKEKIMAMKPGRELDAIVSQKIFGWQITPSLRESSNYNRGIHPYTEKVTYFPSPSTTIADAWEVVEELQRKHPMFTFNIQRRDYTKSVLVWIDWRQGHNENIPNLYVEADTLPEAVCKIALIVAFRC
jgi:hypothetical protein